MLVTMTLAIQLPSAILLGATLARAGVALAPLLALAALVLSNLPLALRIGEGLVDRPTSLPRLVLVDLPYYALWAACFAFVFVAPLAWTAAVLHLFSSRLS